MEVVEHAIVAVVVIWVVKRIYDLGLEGMLYWSVNGPLLRFPGVKNLILKTVISGLKVIPGTHPVHSRQNTRTYGHSKV